MTSESITFAGDKVALIVRGKTSAQHHPGKLQQHADCVRSNGTPVGYFARDPTQGEGESGYMSSAAILGTGGKVYDMDEFLINRPYYVDLHQARAMGAISTALTVQVSAEEAAKFDEYWTNLKSDPGTFRLLGKNCSTRASGAFTYSGILSGGIPGLDTPDNLYRQLNSERPERCKSYSGYIGFDSTGNSSMMIVETP